LNEDIFRENGGKFITPVTTFRDNLQNCKAILFDWDGVFNSGEKGGLPSSFNEVDSMGINMLRFGYFMTLGHIPYTAIVTGETNRAGFSWAKRERFDHVYYQVKNKVDLLPILKEKYQIEADQVLFVFDDILDLSLAEVCGARFLVNRKANPLFNAYCIKNNYCDYLTYSAGNENAIREVTEVVLDGIDMFDETIKERVFFHGQYKDFLSQKMAKETRFMKYDAGEFTEKTYKEIS
jgi:3-deoxy-D-manno-octulosonate 8-phosphate phosphatase (KDO 8-P phosphatase)